jgi:pyrimidine deaminase RibD-like protein
MGLSGAVVVALSFVLTEVQQRSGDPHADRHAFNAAMRF